MTKNQLPEGIGKKIVEALKKQTELEFNSETTKTPTNILDNVADSSTENEIPLNSSINYYNSSSNLSQEEQTESEALIIEDNNEPDLTQDFVGTKTSNVNLSSYSLPNTDQEPMQNFDIPANVVVLRKLVNQLPPGVSKQTGAQIIRQTIEALGISMNSVLGEAQGVQDNLNMAIKECTVKIQEYKSDIAYLEKNVQEYQKQARQVNDLISLFILTENNTK